jgi:hypothetical protein
MALGPYVDSTPGNIRDEQVKNTVNSLLSIALFKRILGF